MKTKQATRKGKGAQSIKYAWVGVWTLIAALMLTVLSPAPGVWASMPEAKEPPFGLQSGLVMAHLDSSGRPSATSEYVPFGLKPGLVTAAGVGYIAPLDLVGGKGLPFGLESGLVTARGVGYVAQFGLAGGVGLPFGLEAGLVTAHLDGSGLASAVRDAYRIATGRERGIDAGAARYQAMASTHVQRGIEAGAARYQAMAGRYVLAQTDADSARYQAMAERYVQRGIEAGASRYQALAAAYSDGSRLPYTDVSKFYVERLRSEIARSAKFADSPELLSVRSFGFASRPGAALLATDPELTLARRYYGAGAAACSLDVTAATLAANPELSMFSRMRGC